MTAIVGRTRGVVAGAVAGFVLLTSSAFRAEALSGMESVVAAMLGMLVILLVIESRLMWAGVILGLAIVNKVDAGFLALAVGSAWLVVHRRLPWRLAAVAGFTAAPWFLFSWLYFGSILPFSATQKIGGEVTNAATSHDPLWVLHRMAREPTGILLAGLVLVLVVVAFKIVRLERRASLTVVSCGLWVVLHGAAFSLVDLGDPYPWYTAVLYPPMIVGGVLAVFVLAHHLSAAVPSIHRSGMSPRGLTAALLVLVMVSLEPGIHAAGRVVRGGHDIAGFEKFDNTRRLGGRYVGEHAEPGEVVESCFGWVAFGALKNPFKETCPLSTRIDPGPPTWIVESWLVGDHQDPPPGHVLVKSFLSPHGDTFVYHVPR